MSTTAKLFKNGHSLAVRLPRAYRLPGKEVAIHREGDRIVLEPLAKRKWPKDFFKKVRISDPAFERPLQGDLPPSISFGK